MFCIDSNVLLKLKMLEMLLNEILYRWWKLVQTFNVATEMLVLFYELLVEMVEIYSVDVLFWFVYYGIVGTVMICFSPLLGSSW